AGASPVVLAGQPVPTFADPAFVQMDDAPPVRQLAGGPESNGESSSTVLGNLELPPGEMPRRRRLLPILLVCLILAAAGGLVWRLTAPAPSDEAERFARAEKQYKDRNFGDAAVLFASLLRDFPDSEQRPVYQFFAELSDIREPIHKTQTNVKETLDHLARLSKFLDTYQSDPLLAKHREDVSESLYRLVEELTAFAASSKDRPLLAAARRLNDLAAKKFVPAPAEQAKGIDAALIVAEQAVAKEESRNFVLGLLAQCTTSPSLDAVEQAKLAVQKAGLGTDPEIKALVDDLPAQHQKAIKFYPELAADSSPWKAGDSPPSIAVTSQRPFGVAKAGSRPVLAIVRGVLYAFDPDAGTLRWACRVGVDTTALPLWLPGTPATPPTVLVVSSDAGGLLALDGNVGSTLWRQTLPEPCQAQPTVVGNHVFVACRSGAVFEIDLGTGRRLGGYQLGQTLTHGGIWQPGTDNLFFAGQRGCVYVLDVAQRHCAGILYTGHPSGSLHCPPVILSLSRGDVLDPSKAGPAPAQMLLCQDDNGTLLHSFVLPFASPHATPTVLGDKLPGRTWFKPHDSVEHVSLVTDAGAFAVFGLRQRENRDADIFAVHRQTLAGGDSVTAKGRPAVVHADSQNFWVLANGSLHHFQAALSAKEGWRIVGRASLGPVGSALHAGQEFVDGHGRSMLFLVTESPDGRACWLTAVDLNEHSIRWQRPIGFLPQGSPLVGGGKVLAWDQGGDLLTFDPQKPAHLPGGLWQVNGYQAVRNQAGAAWLLPHADGQSLIALAVHNNQAHVWKHQAGITNALGGPVTLDAAAAGTPALVGDTVILPLANGRLACINGGKVLAMGDWRSPEADSNALGHVVAVGPSMIACNDGSKGVTLWRLNGNVLVRLKTAKAKSRIVAVASGPPSSELRVCIADVDRRVTLLQGDDLHFVREWLMSDAITAGPFVRGGYIVVVVGGRRLVWLDPQSDKAQGFTFRSDIVGEPHLIDGLFIVADEGGQIQALDPSTRQLVGLGYTLHANVAAAATPVPYGTDRFFVALTDGTVLLPSRDWFRPKFLGMPVRR
ncbi:MAG TPA: PQQ-binding-like beta-propeller repeat protein, partial [Gemmataceae bacterium]|nr:PQQ-binding-like beta-propeller repeat protein [Gemmataceae bacterium]